LYILGRALVMNVIYIFGISVFATHCLGANPKLPKTIGVGTKKHMSEQFKDQQGYFAFVQNSGDVDYLRLAYLQALSIKATQRINNYAIAVDENTKAQITDKHRAVFDYIVDIPFGDDAADDEWKLANAWKLYYATPFKETVNLDVDMIFTRDVSHWWDHMRAKDICITTNVLDYRGNLITDRRFRKVFDDNNLLNTYNGFSYFRYSKTMADFFVSARGIFQDWPLFRDNLLKNCRIEKPTTDEVYALAAMLTGEERCYIPGVQPTFVHMKPELQGFHSNRWTDMTSWTLTEDMDFIVGGYYQMIPFHYQQKDFCSDELIRRYEAFIF